MKFLKHNTSFLLILFKCSIDICESFVISYLFFPFLVKLKHDEIINRLYYISYWVISILIPFEVNIFDFLIFWPSFICQSGDWTEMAKKILRKCLGEASKPSSLYFTWKSIVAPIWAQCVDTNLLIINTLEGSGFKGWVVIR